MLLWLLFLRGGAPPFLVVFQVFFRKKCFFRGETKRTAGDLKDTHVISSRRRMANINSERGAFSEHANPNLGKQLGSLSAK